MADLTSSFTELLATYSKRFKATHHTGSSRTELMKTVPAGLPGVYLIWRQGGDRPLYIGSSGKLTTSLNAGKSAMRSRLFYASTPYFFDSKEPVWRHGPTTKSVRPAGYKNAIKVSELRVTCIATPTGIAPSALEHVLIQGFINEFGNLPEANQKI